MFCRDWVTPKMKRFGKLTTLQRVENALRDKLHYAFGGVLFTTFICGVPFTDPSPQFHANISKSKKQGGRRGRRASKSEEINARGTDSVHALWGVTLTLRSRDTRHPLTGLLVGRALRKDSMLQ